jgi:hypothetical protein
MNEPVKSSPEREPRVGERVSLGGRPGVLRYLYGTGAAVVRFDDSAGTKVVPLRRLVSCSAERAVPDDVSSPAGVPGRRP